jgi:hypothetical protein
MPTPAQEAFAEGFAELASVHAEQWTFGEASFAGVASALRPDDPRLQGNTDRVFELTVSTAAIPLPAPTRGDEIARGAARYRVIRPPDHDPATGLSSLLIVQA